MVSKSSLVEGFGFELSLCDLFPIYCFESSLKTLFGVFDSPRVGMSLHVREDIKDMIFILNQNLTSLSF